MRKAYDTILQSEVSADLAAKNSGFEPYRYECACCGEEVKIAAAHSTNMVPHFRHCNGNNDVECENYLGQYGAISIDARSRKSNRERVEFYFERNTKTFCLGLRFSSEEINVYEQNNVDFELRSSSSEQALFTLPINSKYFAPESPTMIPINKFSYSYFLSNTFNGIKRKYTLFELDNKPIFFKFKGDDSNKKAKLVHGRVLYTNVSYFVVFQSQYSLPQGTDFPDEIKVEDSFFFKTMGKAFFGGALTIKSKTPKIEKLLLSWGYQLEASETLSLLWPTAALIDDVSVIGSADHAFLYSSFELQAHGNINIHSEDIYTVMNRVSKVSVNPKTKVFKKNAEIIIDKSQQPPYTFENIILTESAANTYIVPDNGTYFLFNNSGVKCLCKGQSVLLTLQSEIRHYYHGYLKDRIYPLQQQKLIGENLLNDILSHYRHTESFDKNLISTCVVSKTALDYIEKCESSGLINTVAKQFIEEGRL